MTNKEAIECLKALEEYINFDVIDGYDIHESFFLAIKSLENNEPKKGEWIEFGDTHNYRCSVCGRCLFNIAEGKNKVSANYPFCHCGAYMREGEEE